VISSATKSEAIKVDAPAAASVVRSVAWDSGWRATVSVDGGPPQTIRVESFDLVQRVHIPAGDDLVTFVYRPPHLQVATVLSLGASALLIVLLAVWVVRRRSSRVEHRVSAPGEVIVTGVPEHVG
jgi:uncharacterized membrane protein YfhO